MLQIWTTKAHLGEKRNETELSYRYYHYPLNKGKKFLPVQKE